MLRIAGEATKCRYPVKSGRKAGAPLPACGVHPGGIPPRSLPPVLRRREERERRGEGEPDGRARSEAKVVVACVAHGEGGRRSGSRRAGEDQRSQRADVRVAEVASKQSAVVARGASESREARRRCGRRCRSCRRRGTTGMKAVRAILGGPARVTSGRDRMSFGRSDPIRSLILHGSPSGFSRPAEGWSACSNDDILVAAAKQLGVLQQRREYRDNVGQARANWQQHRSNLAQVYVWQDASMHDRARTELVKVAPASAERAG